VTLSTLKTSASRMGTIINEYLNECFIFISPLILHKIINQAV
jgi:hypothetical protein